MGIIRLREDWISHGNNEKLKKETLKSKERDMKMKKEKTDMELKNYKLRG
jgi:hypothetical protein